MRLRELGVGLAFAGVVAGCSPNNQEVPPPTGNSEATPGALPCTGALGKISVVNANFFEFKVDEIKGSPECEETPTAAGIMQLGRLGTGKEPVVGELHVGDTFRVECDLGKPAALLVQFDLHDQKDGEGLMMLGDANPAVEDRLAETGVVVCNQEQLDRALGR